MDSTASYPDLVRVLYETREFLARPDNDFVWSSWDTAANALDEIDGFIAGIEAGDVSRRSQLQALFAPTGPIQEVAASSGWGEEFLRLAVRFDAAMKKV
jgi:hypothetical protein